jgi:Domain of unknown function (DUF4397)
VRKVFVASVALVLAVGAQAVTQATPGNATVTIVHGLPGFTADIYVNDELLLDGFRPTSTAGPLDLPAGRYDVDIREVGAAPDSDPVLSAALPIRAGSNISVVAHLTRTGDGTLTVFVNAFPRLAPGKSLLRVRHVAEGPSLSVRVDGRVMKEGLSLGGEWGTTADAGRHRISVRSSSSDDTLVPSTPIVLKEGSAEIVYVVGSADAGDVDLMHQSIAGRGSVPSSVLSGDGGLGADASFPAWVVTVIVVAGLTLVVSVRRSTRAGIRHP